jgi:hypothetical protein
MQLNDQTGGTKGTLTIVIRGPNGRIKQRIVQKNLVVTAGKGLIATRMTGTGTAPSHMAIGSGSTAAAAGDTALGTELGRVALSSSTPAANVATYVASFPAGTGTGAVREFGLLNAGAGGTLLCRSLSSGVITKDAADSMSVSWAVTYN